jgi:hypothetical protein
MTLDNLEETRITLRKAGIEALRASGLCQALINNVQYPHLSDLAVETFTEQVAVHAWNAYRRLRESGLIPQNG